MLQTILATMLFNNDKFNLQGKQYTMTCIGEPTTGHHTIINAKMKNGERRQIKLHKNALVTIWNDTK